MYFEKDYILRQIQMMVQFIQRLVLRLLHSTDEQQFEQAQEEVNALSKKLTGLDIDSLAATMLMPGNAISEQTLLSQPVVGELLLAYALLLEKQGDADAERNTAEAAARIICHTTDDAEPEERVIGVKLLVEKLGDGLHPETMLDLAAFFEIFREYADMENMLFEAIDNLHGEPRDKAIQWGISIYEKLVASGDSDGGLPIDERISALSELKNMRKAENP